MKMHLDVKHEMTMYEPQALWNRDSKFAQLFNVNGIQPVDSNYTGKCIQVFSTTR